MNNSHHKKGIEKLLVDLGEVLSGRQSISRPHWSAFSLGAPARDSGFPKEPGSQKHLQSWSDLDNHVLLQCSHC